MGNEICSNLGYLATLPTTFFEERLHLQHTDANRMINCIIQISKKLNVFSTETHKMENTPFDIGKAEEAIYSLTNPQEKEYFINVLYFVSDLKSPLNPITVSNEKKIIYLKIQI